jgi:adenylyl- and sulfurtransferase ThiI
MTADMGLEERIAALRGKVTGAQQRKARADHELAVAQAAQEAAQKALRDEFGAHRLSQAHRLLAELDADLAAACTEAEKALEEAGG